ncbi:hypothetical protein L1987_45897 [Smallanthus sonchifolius]|uniref:Uncharacterized protein n=1 Tax=Smallanthus sonchifolius TaxID=185202 RepID=A0ACB9FZ89_9ASTR|nr:hypothetical protein L1987_45897 [Smallanthus sonchifolius]
MVLNEVGEAYLPSSAMFARKGVTIGAQLVAGGLRHNPARGIKGLVLPAFRVIADLSRSLRVLASQPALIQVQSILFIGRLTTGYKIGSGRAEEELNKVRKSRGRCYSKLPQLRRVEWKTNCHTILRKNQGSELAVRIAGDHARLLHKSNLAGLTKEDCIGSYLLAQRIVHCTLSIPDLTLIRGDRPFEALLKGTLGLSVSQSRSLPSIEVSPAFEKQERSGPDMPGNRSHNIHDSPTALLLSSHAPPSITSYTPEGWILGKQNGQSEYSEFNVFKKLPTVVCLGPDLELFSTIDCSKEPYLAKGISYLYFPDREDGAIAVMVIPPTTETQTPKGCILSSILRAIDEYPDQARVKVQRIQDRAKGFIIFN